MFFPPTTSPDASRVKLRFVMKWQTTSLGEFYDRGEDSVVYYDPVSGGTHLISEFAAYLIQQIADTPLSTEHIIEGLPDIAAENLPALSASIPEILSQLTDLDIIRHD
jgi:hypothetical protein